MYYEYAQNHILTTVFNIYTSLAMQGEHKVIRLERQAIHIHFSYMLDEIAPDQLLPHLVERKLLSRDKANEVMEISSQIEKVSAIIRETRANAVVGTLPTFCGALVSAELPHTAKKLTDSEYLKQISCKSDP